MDCADVCGETYMADSSCGVCRSSIRVRSLRQIESGYGRDVAAYVFRYNLLN
jgi:hypothetical protein